MKRFLVYDLPLRIFHWIFSVVFMITIFIAKTYDDESPTFSYHMLAGMILSFMVFWRLIWGLIGTQYSRFSTFQLRPQLLISYLKGILFSDKQKWSGHNPASSWASILMFICTFGLGISGFLMINQEKKIFKEIHEFFAHGFLILVIVHIAGVIFHSIRHRDLIVLSMINGTKSGISEDDSIKNSKLGYGVVFLVLTLVYGIFLFKNYNSQTRSLNLFGTTLQLGENEENEESEEHERNE